MKKWIISGAIILAICVFVALALIQTKPTITKTQDVTMHILPKPDFTMEVVPSEFNVYLTRTYPILVELTSVNDFSGEVVVSVSGLPSGVTIEYLPDTIATVVPGSTFSIQLNITVPDDVSLIGDHVFTVTATSDTYN